MSYYILMDSRTKTFYMRPGQRNFFAYTDLSFFEDDFEPSAKLSENRDMSDLKEFTTAMYNSGFASGYLDGKLINLARSDAEYTHFNENEILFAQYILTGEKQYLERIRKEKLLTVCKNEGTRVLFPVVELPDGREAILSYTSKEYIPPTIAEKYPDPEWKYVYVTFEFPCLVNDAYIRM